MTLREHRAAITRGKARVAALPNVLGVGWGVKITQRRQTARSCFTVFVAEKESLEKLSRRSRIPKSIRLTSGTAHTDVVRLGKLRREAELYVRCENQLGTAGLFAAPQAGPARFAVSCAHVMWGDDGAFQGNEIVGYYRNNWQRLGLTIGAKDEPGDGSLANWGLFDGAIASIEDPAALAALGNLVKAEIFDHESTVEDVVSLRGQSVYAQRADGEQLEAVVFAVLTDNSMPGFDRHDLLIRHPSGRGLTRVGDSGLVWRLQNRNALAIHLGGYAQNQAGLSIISAAFFVRRIERRFKVRLLDA